MRKNSTLKKLSILALFFTLAFVLPKALEAQTSHRVSVTNTIFTPKHITIEVGDTVVWVNEQGFHNVNGMRSTYPNNAESFGNGTGVGWTYKHVFKEVGKNDYQCDPHVSLGMVGTVTVEEGALGIGTEQIKTMIRVYPNPTSDFIRISSATTTVKFAELQLIATTGQVVVLRKLDNQAIEHEIDLTSLPRGKYFLRLKELDGKSLVYSIIKQ